MSACDKRPIVVLVFLAVCSVVVIVGGCLDRNGLREFTVSDIGPMAIFLCPYILLGIAAIISYRRHNMTRGALAVTAVLAGMAVTAFVSDMIDYLRTPPGRATQAMRGFLAAIVASLGGLFVLANSVIAKPIENRNA